MFKKLLAIVLSVSMLLSIFIPGTFATSSDSDSATSQLTLETQPTDPQPTETSAPAVVICGNCGAEGHEANICPACPECKQTAAHAEGCSFNTVSVTSDTAPQPCTTCGVVGCTSGHENWCTICLADNCGQTHVMCANCGSSEHATEVCPACPVCKQVNGHTEDCVTTSENWCTICKMENCGKDHTACANCGSSEHNTEVCPACPECKQVENHAADCSKALASVDDTEPKDMCPYCDETVAEDGTVTHATNCNAAYAYDGSNDVGKYAKFNEAYGFYIVYGSSDTGDVSYVFEYSDFMEGTVVSISGWHWDYQTTALLYKVSFYSGGVKDEYAAYWPAEAWLLQRYTDYADSNALTFVTPCAVCGVPGCTTNHKPITDAVIPDVPTLTPGADVSLVDAYGNPITGGAILRIREGTKFSMSAWTGLTDVGDETYRWEINSDEIGMWIPLGNHTSKGLLTSMAMFNSLCNEILPSIRCVITTGGVEKISQAIPVAALKEETRVDSASSVSVSGWLPVDANLNVTPQTPEQAGLAGKYDISDVSVFNDITLMRGGRVEYQPEDGDYLTIVYPEAVVLASGLKVGDTYQIYHINGDDVYVSEEMVYNGGDIVMNFDKLSVFGFSKTVASGETDECPLCGAAPAADGTVTHAADCNMQYSVDASNAVGQPHVFSFNWNSALVYPTCPGEDFNYSSGFIGFNYYGTNPIVKVEDWYWDAASTALCYKVAAMDGETLPEGLSSNPWVFVDYTKNSYGYALVPVDISLIGKTAAFKDDSVILYDKANYTFSASPKTITSEELPEFVVSDVYSNGAQVVFYIDAENWPAGYEAYHFVNGTNVTFDVVDEPIVLNKCAICGVIDCVVAHLYCSEHNSFDCDLEHEKPESSSPITSAVVPANPIPTSGVDVSVADADGQPVTASGFALQPGMRSSLWAFGNGVSGAYQWQIQYDGEWIDILGQTSQGLVVSPAMLFNNSSAVFRCKVTSGENEYYSQEIPVYVQSAVEPAAARGLFVLPRAASLAAPVADEDDNKCTITVQFMVNGQSAAKAFTAELPKGSDFNDPIMVPAITGYSPTFNGNPVGTEDGKTVIRLGISRIQSDVTYQVVYVPAEVEYKIEHYWQNVNNDLYTLHETTSGSALTDSILPPNLATEYPGFYALVYEQLEVAADGSTTLKIYYDRNYYLMLFNLDGGYGVNPIYGRYGSAVTIGEPTRPGYEFDGWEPEVPETIPPARTQYTAKWKMVDTAKVTVVFWGENANDSNYSYLKTGIVEVKTGTNYTFSEDGTTFVVCGTEEHTHTSACGPICGKVEHKEHTDACLICTHTTHTTDCYSAGTYGLMETTRPDADLNDRGNGIFTYTTGYWPNRTTHYYVQIGETWYCAKNRQGNANDTTQISFDCSHVHSDTCYRDEIHEHTAACFSCGYIEHTHSSACDQVGSGLDTNLWKLNDDLSESVTVAPDGSSVINVYYDRVEYTFTFRVNNNNVHSFSAKWGSNISELWTFRGTNGTNYSPANKDSWTGNTLYTARIYMVEIMPARNITFTRASGNNDSRTFHYYVESLTNAAGDGKRLFESKYYDFHFQLVNDFRTLYYDEDFFELEGFDRYKSARENGTEYPLSNSGTNPINPLYFYYTRHKYNLEFYNPTTLLKTEVVPFDAPLSGYNWTPAPKDAPSQYEPGSVVFEGWYLNPECTLKVDFTKDKMPPGVEDGDTTLALYAKWVPVKHTVEFYLDKAEYDSGTSTITSTHPTLKDIPHGSFVEKEIKKPETEKYKGFEFISWFYVDENGNENAFDFKNMPINTDLKVYAKWYSNTLQTYTIYYKLLDEDGNETDTQVAAPTTGNALVGSTKTVYPKGGGALDKEYQVGYFPDRASHNIPIEMDAAKNTFTFWYSPIDNVPYTVKYLHKETGESLIDDKVVDPNEKSIVTETFVPIPGYMSDAYQRVLVLSADPTKNVIIFYYTEDNEHAYYKVTHYIGADGENWEEYFTYEDQGNIGSNYYGSPMTISNYTFIRTDYVVGENVVKQYYPANDQDTGVALTAYGLAINLYYLENDATIYYEAVGPEGATDFGHVDREKETLKVLTGEAQGSTAIAGENYSFEGWYVDEDCLVPVTAPSTVENDKLTPVKSGNSTWKDGTTYYAKFVEQEATINYVVDGPAGCGTVDPTSETLKVVTGVAEGSEAAAAENYVFMGWYDQAGNLVSEEEAFTPTKAEGEVWVDGTTYYAKFEEVKVKLNYVAVGPDEDAVDFGTVTPTVEEVEVLTGDAKGSAANPGTNFRFIGWFEDEKCTGKPISNDPHFVPTKPESGVWEDDTFYALFEYDLADLTITKTGWVGQDIDENQSFVFYVSGTDARTDAIQALTVVIHGNGSATIRDLPIGSYRIVEQSGWSWRYTGGNADVDLQVGGSEVTISNTRVENLWLSGDNFNENQFTITESN